jgi:hypothetical protein
MEKSDVFGTRAIKKTERGTKYGQICRKRPAIYAYTSGREYGRISPVKETLTESTHAETALAQARQVEPSRGQIPADRALIQTLIRKSRRGE